LLAARRQALPGLFPYFVGNNVIEEQFPIAAPRRLRVGVQYPDYWHANVAQLVGQRIDRLDNLPRSRHLRRRSRRAEQFLHVDDDQSRAPWIELVEPVIASAPREHAIDDLLAYRHLVHRVLDSE